MAKIKAVALDVDGVLTDGTFWWGSAGEEFKRFSFRDIMGISLGRKAGLIFALISGETSPLIERFASKMQITDIYQGCKDKAAALNQFAQGRGLALANVCFMGDDVNDLGALGIAGLSAAPADAHEKVLGQVQRVLARPGGRGAVRELIDGLLAEQAVGPQGKLRQEA